MKKKVMIAITLMFLFIPGIVFGQILNYQKTQLTTGDKDAAPAWSPDGDKIAFASDRFGNYDIWVIKTDGNDLINLTSSSMEEKYPSWNPIGTKIAYIAYDPDAGVWGGYFLYTMNADGSGKMLHPLPPGEDQEEGDNFWSVETRLTAWSPDGDKIAFVSYGPNGGFNKIYQYNLTNNQVTEITPAGEANPAGMIYKISWCGATNLFVFDRYPIGLQTFTPGVDDLQVLSIPREGMFDTETMPGWNPDGTKVAYIKGIYGDSYIGIFDPTTETEIVEAAPSGYKWPVWSPDGKKIAVKDGDFESGGNIWILTMLELDNILLKNTSDGRVDLWFMKSDGTVGSEKTLFTDMNSTIVGKGDFNADGIYDLLKRNTVTGQTVVWFMKADGSRASYKTLFTAVNSTIVGTGDFNDDGICDLLKRDSVTGQTVLWFMNADGTRDGYKVLFTDVNSTIVGTGDFNGDGICDLLKRNTVTGQTVLWFMNDDGSRAGYKILFTAVNSTIVGTGDFNNDGICDLIKRDSVTGQSVLWFMNDDGSRASYKVLFTAVNATVASTGDFNGDGISDLLKRDAVTGQTVLWFMNADGTRASYKILLTDPDWTIVP